MNKLDIFVPDLPESVDNAKILKWHKKSGDIIKKGDILLDIETDKVVMEIPSDNNGILKKIIKKNDDLVFSKEKIGELKLVKKNKNINNENIFFTNIKNNTTPAIRKLINKHNLKKEKITGSGSKGKITKQDVDKHIKYKKILKNKKNAIKIEKNNITRIPMNPIRKCISNRLMNSKNNTVTLTTFNEVNMKNIINIRKKYSETFKKRHKIKLGFMSFFVKAVSKSLECYPNINAYIDQQDIVYFKDININIAISTSLGVVTPLLKNTNIISIANIEKKIKKFITKSNNNKLTIDNLKMGGFTITNGGVFGSLMSTPIINPPQSAILGMHVIKDRPMALNGIIKILPMMYLSLSYDHRIIDGKESVGFLSMVKNFIEDTNLLFLDI
ncbi:dihydrolipoyllysine-residue succinyltransferase [Buchnera aphidicola (Taiwanaphis decaspermi)]|uniref:dihydrolipoyllysine-residue succinyltransferase n=1 Tax=Buchnera aphidicola TaxID=9 RepID=UPI0031B7F573